MSYHSVMEHALTVYYDGNRELTQKLLALRKAEIRAEVLREAAEGVQSGDAVFDTATVETVARNAGPVALVAYAQLAIAEHLRKKADEAKP